MHLVFVLLIFEEEELFRSLIKYPVWQATILIFIWPVIVGYLKVCKYLENILLNTDSLEVAISRMILDAVFTTVFGIVGAFVVEDLVGKRDFVAVIFLFLDVKFLEMGLVETRDFLLADTVYQIGLGVACLKVPRKFLAAIITLYLALKAASFSIVRIANKPIADTGPTERAYTGPTEPAYTGPTEPAYTGPTEPAYTGPTELAYTGLTERAGEVVVQVESPENVDEMSLEKLKIFATSTDKYNRYLLSQMEKLKENHLADISKEVDSALKAERKKLSEEVAKAVDSALEAERKKHSEEVAKAVDSVLEAERVRLSEEVAKAVALALEGEQQRQSAAVEKALFEAKAAK